MRQETEKPTGRFGIIDWANQDYQLGILGFSIGHFRIISWDY